MWTIKLQRRLDLPQRRAGHRRFLHQCLECRRLGPERRHDANYFFTKIEGYDDLNPLDAKKTPGTKKMKGLVKKDELTFEVTLQEPYVNFKSMLGYTPFFPLPNAAFTDVANNQLDPAFEDAPIGQGAFRMQGKWQHDQLIQLVRYDSYAGPVKPHIDGIDFKIYQTLPTQYQDLLAGQLDIVPQIPLENMANAPADLGSRFQQSMGSTIQILAFPTYDKRFSKVEVRKAISMAIDRDRSCAPFSPMRGYRCAPSWRPSCRAPARTPAARPASSTRRKPRRCSMRPAAPRPWVAASSLRYNVDGGHKPWIDAACNQIRANLGVECVGNPQPKFADLLRKAKAKESMGLFRMGWVADYPVLENYLGPLYATRGSSNYYGYSNAEYDKLLAAGDRAATPDEAIKLYQQAEDILTRELPVLPLRYMQNTFGISPRVANVELDPFRLVRWLKVTAAGTDVRVPAPPVAAGRPDVLRRHLHRLRADVQHREGSAAGAGGRAAADAEPARAADGAVPPRQALPHAVRLLHQGAGDGRPRQVASMAARIGDMLARGVAAHHPAVSDRRGHRDPVRHQRRRVCGAAARPRVRPDFAGADAGGDRHAGVRDRHGVPVRVRGAQLGWFRPSYAAELGIATFILPAIVLALLSLATGMRLTRNSGGRKPACGLCAHGGVEGAVAASASSACTCCAIR